MKFLKGLILVLMGIYVEAKPQINGCLNDWKAWNYRDTSPKTCQRYIDEKWCTEEGALGPRWKAKWKNFTKWADANGNTARACPQCGCKEVSCTLEYNREFWGRNMKNFDAPNLQACQQICIERHPQCIAFSYDKKNNRCYEVTSKMLAMRTVNKKFDSGLCQEVEEKRQD